VTSLGQVGSHIGRRTQTWRVNARRITGAVAALWHAILNVPPLVLASAVAEPSQECHNLRHKAAGPT